MILRRMFIVHLRLERVDWDPLDPCAGQTGEEVCGIESSKLFNMRLGVQLVSHGGKP